MFSRSKSVQAITSHLELYQQAENLPSKLYKSMVSSFLKTVKRKEEEVAAKLEEGNPDDHSRHEEYILENLDENLQIQMLKYLNRGVGNTNTFVQLKRKMEAESWDKMMEMLSGVVRRVYVKADSVIFDINAPESKAWCGVLFLRHGEGFFVDQGHHSSFEFLDSIDMLGVVDNAFINGEELHASKVNVISRTPCIVGILTMNQIVDTIKRMQLPQETTKSIVSYLLARMARLENERRERQKEEERKREETNRKHLMDWSNYLRNGDLINVKRYIDGGFNIDSDIGSLRDKPLILCIYGKNIELLKYLIEKKASINCQNENGSTALHICCQVGWIEGIKVLLENKASLLPDKEGNLPLHIAARQGNLNVIEYFVGLNSAYKNDFMVRNQYNETVIDCCMDIEMKKIIVPKGVLGYSFER